MTVYPRGFFNSTIDGHRFMTMGGNDVEVNMLFNLLIDHSLTPGLSVRYAGLINKPSRLYSVRSIL